MRINEGMTNVLPSKYNDAVLLDFDNIHIDDLQPVHLVTLACLIEFFDRMGYSIGMANAGSPVGRFLFETLRFPKYWQGNQNHVPAGNVDTIFNLWRLVEAEKEVYCQRVHDYLQRKFFKNKDLSVVQNSLLEAFYNISDHAEANGNAFSFIKFDEDAERLYVAVCDFGKGIANSVREKLPEIGNDGDALRKAMEDLFTVGSRDHNKGLGLGNIRNACTGQDNLRIISNRGFLYSNSDHILVRESNIILKGTLIYYELSLSRFDDLEIMPNFEL